MAMRIEVIGILAPEVDCEHWLRRLKRGTAHDEQRRNAAG